MEPQYFDKHTSNGLVKQLKKMRLKYNGRFGHGLFPIISTHFQGFNILEPYSTEIPFKSF